MIYSSCCQQKCNQVAHGAPSQAAHHDMLHGRRLTGDFGGDLVKRFLDDASNSVAPAALVLDVGANQGNWGHDVLLRLLRRTRRTPPRHVARLVSFEPQPQYLSNLLRQAREWNASHLPRSSWTVLPFAAWKEATNLTFYLSKFTEASSLVAEQALAFSDPGPWCEGNASACIRPVSVPAIDFASYLHAALGPPGTVWPVMLKLDVEAAEYDVLPSLLVSGALCAISHIFIECTSSEAGMRGLPDSQPLPRSTLTLARSIVLASSPAGPKGI